jgi:hypothetical protein
MHKKEQYMIEVNNEPTGEEMNLLMLKVYEQVCRNTFDKPGFSYVKLCYEIESKEFRRLTVKLIEKLDKIYFEKCNASLECITMGRYDQKETTKFHLDGGPDESYLVLGYEPSEVKSELSLADYSLAAFEMNLSPKEFLLNHNPMFSKGENLLKPYITDLVDFDSTKTNLLFVNNSSMALGDKLTSLGVLHRAKITHPFADKSRVINSIQLGNTLNLNSNLDLSSFIDLAVISRKPYE